MEFLGGIPILQVSIILAEVARYLDGCALRANELIGQNRKTNGPEGTVSDKTKTSVCMISSGGKRIGNLFRELNDTYPLHLNSTLTMQVENTHAVTHQKNPSPAVLNYRITSNERPSF